jgi:acetyl esterase
LVFAHGGGFVLGDIESHDALCRILAIHAGVHVVSIEYRRSPDHKLPAAIDDLQAALSWALANAESLGADPAHVGVGGDSAGGNLSAIVAWLGARDNAPAPHFQLLLYPAVDRSKPYPSLRFFEKGFLLSRADIDWFHEQHAKHAGLADDDPRVSPLCAPDLRGAAPAIVVTAGFDPLRDEGEAYAKALAAVGTPVTLRRFDGLVHGFANLAPISSSARAAVLEIAGGLRVLSRS